MPVVSIRGLLGSGAPEIGSLVAERLNIDYVDRQIIAEVAARLRRQEQDVIEKELPPGSLLERIAQILGRTYSYEGVGLPAWEMPLDDSRYLQSLESVIKELASTNSIVIFGRGSQFFLKDYPGALHTLVVAPMELRVNRIMQDMESDEETARREIARVDNGGREFVKKYFHTELENPAHYDLVLNTEHLSFDDAASLIISALQFKNPRAGETGGTSG